MKISTFVPKVTLTGLFLTVVLSMGASTTTGCDSLLCGDSCDGIIQCPSDLSRCDSSPGCQIADSCVCDSPTCSASDCNGYDSADNCNGDSKCKWETTCRASMPCYELSDSECNTVSGCSLERNCD